jgi:hypothetical protein
MTNAEDSVRAEPCERERVARALELLEAGDVDQARMELRSALGRPEVLAPPMTPLEPVRAFDDDLADAELDDALARAETDPDEMLSANNVVAKTLESHESAAPDASFDFTEHPTYATKSMAALLEGQGRRNEADAVRAALPPVEAPPAPSEGPEPMSSFGPSDSERLRVVSTLESWLHNIRRGVSRDAASARRDTHRGTS